MILQDELFDEHELGGHGGAHKQPVLLREDLNGVGGRNGGSLLRENEALLQQVKLRFSEKATKFDEIFILNLNFNDASWEHFSTGNSREIFL